MGWIDTYGIHQWRVFRNSSINLVWVGFEPTTTEFCSDAVTDSTISLWVTLAPKANFAELLQLHIFLQFSHFISIFAFVCCHICFKQILTKVIPWVVEWIDATGIHYWKIFSSSCREFCRMEFNPTTSRFHSDALYDWATRPWVQLALRANLVQLLQFHLFPQCSHFISVFAFVSRHICFNWTLAQLVMLVAEWIHTYVVNRWRSFRNSYRNYAWVGLEPTTTEFRSDAVTDWVIRLGVALAPKANFVQLLQLHLFVQSSRFILIFSFVCCHICFKQTLAKVIPWVAEWIDTRGIHHWKISSISYREFSPVEVNPRTTQFHSDALTDWATWPWVQLALRAKFVQLLQFHLFFSVHISFRSLSSSVTTFALSELSHR